MTEQEQLKRESEAAVLGKQILNNRLFQEIVALTKAKVFEDFCGSEGDPDVMAESWRTMKNLDTLIAGFEYALETGKMAESMLELQKKSTN